MQAPVSYTQTTTLTDNVDLAQGFAKPVEPPAPGPPVALPVPVPEYGHAIELIDPCCVKLDF
jgi:hypothetical protein